LVLEKGLGVEQDYRQAIYWYNKGAVAGEPHALNNLGAMYESGLGVQKTKRRRNIGMPRLGKRWLGRAGF